MSDTKVSAVAAAAAGLVLALGCSAGVKPTPTGTAGSTGTDGGVDRPITGTAGATGTGGGSATGLGGVFGGGGTTGTGGTGPCTPTYTCTPAGGLYCNTIGNGCPGGKLECGACPGDSTCSGGTTMPGVCQGGPSCMALTCASGGAVKYCGKVGDGCGRELDCGMCAAGQTCSGGLCVPAGCMPLTCSLANGGKYCGMIGDGCGAPLDCQGCSAPQTCGGAGIQGVCGTPAASCPNRLNCTPMGGQYCGVVGDNCGGSIDCGACANGMACGSNHVCPSTGGTGVCMNLQCQLDKPGECAANTGTSISGTVFDPAGKVPLYNVLVYVPNTALGAIPTGATCDRCDSPISGTPVAAALSGSDGKFKIMNAPSGANIPLVIQIGKWRRKIILPTVTKCQDNAFNDPNLVRLPRNMNDRAAGDAAGDVHMPKIALSTGHSDALDCLLRKIGISDSEFTPDSGTGRVHMYVGGVDKSSKGTDRLASGATFASSYGTLFPTYSKMTGYDILMLQCEGSQFESEKQPYLGNMKRYADNGGRVFADHLHSAWIRTGLPPWPATANWIGVGTDLPSPVTANVDVSFPKGIALAAWLMSTGASTTRGEISLVMGQHSVANVYAPAARRWIWVPHNTMDSAMRESTQYLTFNTPVESAAANQCGRVVFTDVHVSLGSGDKSWPGVPTDDPAGTPFPTGCTAPLTLTAQEKALEFMFFDLSSCVQVETGTPKPPDIPTPGSAPTPPPASTPAPPAPPPPPPPPPPLKPE